MPSVEALFHSAAALTGRKALGVGRTGMCKDGAAAIPQCKRAGGFKIAQDEASCAVFGRPQGRLPGTAWMKRSV